MNYFQKQGRALLGNGFSIIPIRQGEKRPALGSWQTSRFGAGDLAGYPGCGVGILTGQGAHPIAAIDIDTTDDELARRFTDYCFEHLGVTCERVGNAPKLLLPYRAAEAGWGKAFSEQFATVWVEGPGGRMFAEGWRTEERNGKPVTVGTGQIHRVEVLGRGQQFVAYHVHPDTGRPYEWVDLLGGLEFTRADELPIVKESQIKEALAVFNAMAAEVLQPHPSSMGNAAVPAAPTERTPAAEDDFFGRVNEAALAALHQWVPVLFPPARDYQGGFRVSSEDLQRDLQEDLSIVSDGIVDFGVADMGDEREGKRTPIDLVLEWGPVFWDDPLDAPHSPFEAAQWLCEALGAAKEDLGFGLRREREREAVRLAKREGLADLQAMVADCSDTIDLLDGVAQAARDLLAGVPALRAEVAALLKTRFRELSGLSLPAQELSRALREPLPPTVKARRPLTEFGNAERLLDRYGAGLMYVPETSAWYSWTGVFWRRASEVEIEHLAKETVRALVQEIEDHPEPAEFFKWCATSQQAKMVGNMVRLAQSDPRVMVPAAELDKHAHLLCATNGVIDLRTGELLPPDPELRMTCTTGCDYEPKAKATVWERTVAEVFSEDQDTVDFFQRLIGYSACGDPTQDVMVIPYGNGSNGKSTVLGTIRQVFGGYAKAAEASSFVSDGRGGANAGGAREDLLRLKGARFVYANEPDENSELREGAVKSMTGGDAITARGLYSKHTMEILPTWVVFMPTNHRPIVKGSDNGIWRRLLLLPFTRNFEADKTVKKDPNRVAKLQAEMPGILNWIVQGAIQYKAMGLAPAGSVKKAVADYRNDMDLLADWIAECCEVGPEFEEEVATLWSSWEEYAKNNGLLMYVKNSRLLGRRLESRYPSKKGAQGKRMRSGLRVHGGF